MRGTSVHSFRGPGEYWRVLERWRDTIISYRACQLLCGDCLSRSGRSFPSLLFPSPHAPAPPPRLSSPNTWPLDQATKAEACLRVDYSNVCGTCAKRNVVKPCAALPALSHWAAAPFGTCEKEWTKGKWIFLVLRRSADGQTDGLTRFKGIRGIRHVAGRCVATQGRARCRLTFHHRSDRSVFVSKTRLHSRCFVLKSSVSLSL